MSDSYFSTKDLTVGYDKIPLINGINIDVEKGEILTLIGPNGSGKSTILKSISKHLKKLGGTVYIDKESVEALSHKNLSRKLAVVLTERLKVELMTCMDVVATGRYPYTGRFGLLTDKDKDIIEQSMEKVQAYDLKNRNFNAISDGQRQRILLARAICQEPDIIVLDEPTSFLDVRHKLELLNILTTMAKKDHITVIMSLHEIDLAQKVSDKIVCVKGDKINYHGSPNELFNEKLIQELYEMDKGSYNTVFGSVELKRPEGQPKLFVVAGNGSGIEYFRALQKKEIPFYTGVLHENDIDYQIANVLAAEVFVENAFSTISTKTYKAALSALKKCTHLLYTGVEFGEMNAMNQQLIEEARKRNIQLIESI